MPERGGSSALMGGLAVRRARLDDVPAMAAVVNGWIDATDWMPRTEAPEVIEGHIRGAFDAREMWVAGDPVEGYASYDPDRSYLGALYAGTPGKGIGKTLLDRVREGRDFVWLTTHVPNVAAQRFYLREGFVNTGEQAAEPPGDPLPVYRMEWRG